MCKNTLTAMAVFKIFLSPFVCFFCGLQRQWKECF